jgi:hypothetical protein
LVNSCPSGHVNLSQLKGKRNTSLVCDSLLTTKLFNLSTSPNRDSSASAKNARALITSAGASCRAGARSAAKGAAPAASTAAAGASTQRGLKKNERPQFKQAKGLNLNKGKASI